jgi:phage terminase small subunit
MAERSLTGKQTLFVAEYLADLNATQAAIRAGYSPARAGTTGWRNLQNPKIRTAIAEAQAPRLAKLEMDAEAVLAELARIAQANLLDYMRIGEEGEPIVDFSRLDRNRAAALSEVVVEDFPQARGAGKREVRRIRFRLHDKLAALRELARHFGLAREHVGRESAVGPKPVPQHETRQVARAVIAILETARIAEEEEVGSITAE